MKHILLVDTDVVFSRTVSFLLQKENFEVSVAKDGKEAVAALAGKAFDLVITNVFMPYLNGFELINTIRNSKSSSHTSVMVVSEVSNEHNISNCLRLGADAYQRKPLNVPALLSEIKNLITTRTNVAA